MRVLGLMTVTVCVVGCGSGVTNVREVPLSPDPPARKVVVVSHPPPAALPEIVPPSPDERARWLDGFWTFRAGNWVWMRGGWIVPADGLTFSPSRFWYDPGGVMKFMDPAWHDERGDRMAAPEIVLPAATPPTPKLAEDATLP